MKIDILSLYPDYFDSPVRASFFYRAQQAGILSIHSHDLRQYGQGQRRRVDDRCLGGGPGMLLQCEPVQKALENMKEKESTVLFLSPSGRKLTPSLCRHYAKKTHLILLCGHYEGMDQRIVDHYIDEKVSVCDLVLTNGCLAALLFMDSVVRFVPGVLGKLESAEYESFEGGLLEGPQYTLPRHNELGSVPEVLLSGNHSAIDTYRFQKSLEETSVWRADLYAEYFAQIRKNLRAKGNLSEFVLYVEGLQIYKKTLVQQLGLPSWEKKGKMLAVLIGQTLLVLVAAGSMQLSVGVEVHIPVDADFYDRMRNSIDSKHADLWKRIGLWSFSENCLVCKDQNKSLTLVWKKI